MLVFLVPIVLAGWENCTAVVRNIYSTSWCRTIIPASLLLRGWFIDDALCVVTRPIKTVQQPSVLIFKSIAVQRASFLCTVCHYIERNVTAPPLIQYCHSATCFLLWKRRRGVVPQLHIDWLPDAGMFVSTPLMGFLRSESEACPIMASVFYGFVLSFFFDNPQSLKASELHQRQERFGQIRYPGSTADVPRS